MFELTAPEKKVYEYLKGKDFTTIKEMMAALGISKTNCGLGARRLVSRKLLERKRITGQRNGEYVFKYWVYRYYTGELDVEEQEEEREDPLGTSIATYRNPLMNIHKDLIGYGKQLNSVRELALATRK